MVRKGTKQAEIAALQVRIIELEEMLSQSLQKQMIGNESLEHLRARTELIKAMSFAMRACSSVMWSEKATGWDFARLRK